MSHWMGRYREFVAALVQHSNVISKSSTTRQYIYDNIYLTANEWQVLEYIVEQRNQDERMVLMSATLGIPQSSFSKIIKTLNGIGLVERYRSVDNKKNIIVKPTPFALEVYEYHTQQSYQEVFKPFFDALSEVTDKDLETVTEAIELLSNNIRENQKDPSGAEPERPGLIRID